MGVGGSVGALAAVGPALGQLHVVVGEAPEKLLGALERTGVVEVLECVGGHPHELGKLGQQRSVEGVADSALGRVTPVGQGEGELGGVEQLDRQAAPDLHLAFVERGVGAGSAVGGPVAHGVCAVGVEQVHRRHHVALRLGHLLAVGVEDPARQRAVPPRRRAVPEMAAHRGGEQPRPDDVVALGAHVHRVGAGPQVRVFAPAAGDLRGQRRRGPGVHHVVIADEAARLAALRLVVASGHVAAGIDRQGAVFGHQRCIPDRLARAVEPVPQRDRHAEVALAADEPVAAQALDPVGVAALHVGRMPRHLRAAGDQRVAQVGVAPAVADVPLAARHDLERPVALLEELDRMGDRAGLADQLARLPQQLHGCVAGAAHGPARDAGVRLTPGSALDAVRRIGCDAAPAVHDGAHRQVQLAPPRHVGGVAERADHGDAGALVGLGQVMRHHRHLHPEQRRGDRRAEQRLVPGVFGVGHQRHARRQQFRPSGLDLHRPVRSSAAASAVRAGAVEGDAVVGAGPLAVFQFGLRHGGAERHVPQRGRLDLVRLAPLEIPQERPLRDALAALVDGGVGHRPVHAQPELAPQSLEGMLVFRGEHVAQLDEIAPRDRQLAPCLDGLRIAAVSRRLKARVVGQRRVAAHPEVVLDAPLGGQAVVVPAHWVEDLVAGHAPVAGDVVGVGVAEHVPHVQRAAHGGRRRVDAEHLLAGGGAVEAVHAVGFPALRPLRFQPVHGGPVGYLRHPQQSYRHPPKQNRAARLVSGAAASACTS